MKLMAGFIIAIGVSRVIIVTLATIMDAGTAVERVNSLRDAVIIFALGAILWQVTSLLNQKRQ